jgi:hypothetical protein
MKLSKSAVWAFILMIVVAAVTRVLSYNIAGFAPQVAISLFGGAVIKDKKWAFALPILSLLLSDLALQALYEMNISERAGFYEGQLGVYCCFIVVTLYGFLLRKINAINVLLFSVSGTLIFFLLSNFLVWTGSGGFNRPHTFEGLMLCYWDALLYYRDYGLIKGFLGNQALGDLIWSTVLFGGFHLISKTFIPKTTAAVVSK